MPNAPKSSSTKKISKDKKLTVVKPSGGTSKTRIRTDSTNHKKPSVLEETINLSDSDDDDFAKPFPKPSPAIGSNSSCSRSVLVTSVLAATKGSEVGSNEEPLSKPIIAGAGFGADTSNIITSIDAGIDLNASLEDDIVNSENEPKLQRKESTDSWKGLMQLMQTNQTKSLKQNKNNKFTSKGKASKNTKRSNFFLSSKSEVSKKGIERDRSPLKKPKLDLLAIDEMDAANPSYLKNPSDHSPLSAPCLSRETAESSSSASAEICNRKVPEMFLKPTERAAIIKAKKLDKFSIQSDLCEALKLLSTEPETFSSVVESDDAFEGNVVKLNTSFPNGIPTAKGSKSKSKQCPFYKKLPGTRFSVDAFNYGEIPGIEVYFLSHFHSDHYIGLTKNFSKTLVCSPPTANLVRMKMNVNESCIRRLQINTPYIVDGVEVTLLHANHCPGSVMFVFRLPSGVTYFHTGDFRFSDDMLQNHVLEGLRVDCLYLDTTYCDPKYDFPTQTQAIAELIDVVRRRIEIHPKTLIVCGTYVIGKERVYFSLAEAIRSKVFMNYEKRRIMRALENPRYDSYVTEKEELASIHVHQMFGINLKFLSEYLASRKNLYTHIIGVKPSGWQFSSSGDSSAIRSYNNDTVTIIGVPYSEHSSFSELERLVRSLKPNKVQPTVNVGKCEQRESMMNHISKWLQLEEVVKEEALHTLQ